MPDSQQQTAEGFALQHFVEPAEAAAAPVVRIDPDGTAICTITSQAQYDNAGLAVNQVKTMRKDLEAFFKSQPAKGDKRPGVGLCYFTREAWNSANALFRTLDQRLADHENAISGGIAAYDRKKQEEFERRRREEEQRRAAAEEQERQRRLKAEQERQAEEAARQRAAQAKTEEERRKAMAEQAAADRRRQEQERLAEEARREQEKAEQRQAALATKSEEVAKGPAGTIKQKNWEPVVTNLADYLRWVVRTENWQLAEPAEGRLKKHVNALDGKNLPDGVRAERKDIVKRGRL